MVAAIAILPLADAKAHLRVVGDDEDGLITDQIAAAIAALEDFMGRPLVDADAGWADVASIPANVVHAAKLVLGEIYEDRLGPLQDLAAVRGLIGRWIRVSVG